MLGRLLLSSCVLFPALSVLAKTHDDGLATGKQNADVTAQYVAALMSACDDDVRLAAELTISPAFAASDQDTYPDGFLTEISQDLTERAKAFRVQAKKASVAAPPVKPAELARFVEHYQAAVRERDLRNAQSDLESAMRRLSIDEVSIDPAVRRLLATAQGFYREFRKARAPADSWAGKEITPEWEERLASMDRHAADLRREIRLLELYVTLAKLDEITFRRR